MKRVSHPLAAIFLAVCLLAWANPALCEATSKKKETDPMVWLHATIWDTHFNYLPGVPYNTDGKPGPEDRWINFFKEETWGGRLTHRVNVYQFWYQYLYAVMNEPDKANRKWLENTVFPFLRNNKIKIAIEDLGLNPCISIPGTSPHVKANSICNNVHTHGADIGRLNAKRLIRIIRFVRSLGGDVHYINMDGMLSHTIDGGREGQDSKCGQCKFSLDTAMNQAIRMMQLVHQVYGHVKFGWYVNFTWWNYDEIPALVPTATMGTPGLAPYAHNADFRGVFEKMMEKQKNSASKLSFVTVDIPYNYISGQNLDAGLYDANAWQINMAKGLNKIQRLQAQVQSHGLDFTMGVSYQPAHPNDTNTCDSKEDSDWLQYTLKYLDTYRHVVGMTSPPANILLETFHANPCRLEPFDSQYTFLQAADMFVGKIQEKKVGLKRYFTGTDNFSTTYHMPAHFTPSLPHVTLGKVPLKKTGDAIPLRLCKVKNGNEYFNSTHPACEGHDVMGQVAWIYKGGGKTRKPVYRCLSGGKDNFLSLDADCEGHGNGNLIGYIEK